MKLLNDPFLRAYIECALWSSTGDDDTPLDNVPNELAPETIERMAKDCAAFLERAENTIPHLLDDCTLDQLGHDFWLTRNRHGAGFWDGDYEKELGQKLTDLSHAFGERYLYIGDDGLIYQD